MGGIERIGAKNVRIATAAGTMAVIFGTGVAAIQGPSGSEAEHRFFTPTPTFIPTATPTAIPSATPDVQGTVFAILTRVPTITPIPSPTLDIPATVRAAIPTQQPIQTPVFREEGRVLHPDVVQPQVVQPQVVQKDVVTCNPQVVQVPQPYRVEVPVQPTPDPNMLCFTPAHLNSYVLERADKISNEARQAAEAAARASEAARQKAEADLRVAQAEVLSAKGWHFDVWSALVGGVVGLVLGSAAAYRYRERIIMYFYPHADLHP